MTVQEKEQQVTDAFNRVAAILRPLAADDAVRILKQLLAVFDYEA